MIKTILMFILLGVVVNASSQQKIPLQHPDFNEEFYVLEENKIKPDMDLEYYWFKAREVHHAFGACEGLPLDGEYISYYKSLQVKSKGMFKNGLKDGAWMYWNEDGSIYKTEQYRSGELHGEVKEYTNGEKKVTATYKKGELQIKDTVKDSVYTPEFVPMDEVSKDTTQTKKRFGSKEEKIVESKEKKEKKEKKPQTPKNKDSETTKPGED